MPHTDLVKSATYERDSESRCSDRRHAARPCSRARHAREAGVMAYLLKPLRPAELAPALDLAVARFREARDLKQSLEDRKVIERAKGRLMERHALTEEQAFQRLRRAAMDNRRPMVEIARAVLVSDTVTSGTPTSP